MTRIVVLSGPIAVGKSTLAEGLAQHMNMHHLRTRQMLLAEAKSRGVTLGLDRKDLQIYGQELDYLTSYGWLANRVSQQAMSGGNGVIVDSIRAVEQAAVLRKWQDLEVVHIHLEGDPDTLHTRYKKRGGGEDYWTVSSQEPVPSIMRRDADLVLNIERTTPTDLVRLALGHLGVRPPEAEVDAIIGGQYGSEGKGHVVSYLAPEYKVIVRVGGPNAGHTVISPSSGEPVSFYHLPSGALHFYGAMILGPGAVINPAVLQKEIQKSGVDPSRILIDEQAMVITDSDIQFEGDLVKGIGSTGQGVGHATARKVMRSNVPLARECKEQFTKLGVQVGSTMDALSRAMRAGCRILLEGTQGTGLSLHHGHYPYVTSRDTSVGGTAAEAGIAPSLLKRVYMVVRTNPIRVQSPVDGTSGPMSLETTWDVIAERAGIPAEALREREKTTTTKRQRRVSEFDWELLYRAAWLNRPTDICLTFVDYLSYSNREANRFDQLTRETHEFIERIEEVSGAKVSLITTKFEKRSIIDRRSK